VLLMLQVRCVGAVTGASGVAGVGSGIQQMRLDGGGDGQLRGRDSQRRGVLRYIGPDTRPAHVANKQGDVHCSDAKLITTQ